MHKLCGLSFLIYKIRRIAIRSHCAAVYESAEHGPWRATGTDKSPFYPPDQHSAMHMSKYIIFPLHIIS